MKNGELTKKIVDAIQLIEAVANELEDRGERNLTHQADLCYNELESLDSMVYNEYHSEDDEEGALV